MAPSYTGTASAQRLPIARCQARYSAPSPIVSGVRMFRDEFLTHIKDGACPYGA